MVKRHYTHKRNIARDAWIASPNKCWMCGDMVDITRWDTGIVYAACAYCGAALCRKHQRYSSDGFTSCTHCLKNDVLS